MFCFSDLIEDQFKVATLVFNPKNKIGGAVPDSATGIMWLDKNYSNAPRGFHTEVFNSSMNKIGTLNWTNISGYNIYYTHSYISVDVNPTSEHTSGTQYWRFCDFTY